MRIYEWDGPMLHAKTIVADGRWVRVGSSNLNPSSLIGELRAGRAGGRPALGEAMERQFRLDIARSREVTRRLVRGPRRISQALPTALDHREPDVASAHYRRSSREVGRRAALALRTIAANARRSVFLPLTAVFVSLGVLFFVLPRVTAHVFGVICAWLALGAGARRSAGGRTASR